MYDKDEPKYIYDTKNCLEKYVLYSTNNVSRQI